MPPVEVFIDPATLEGHQDLVKHHCSIQKNYGGRQEGLPEYQVKMNYLHCLAKARNEMEAAQRHWRRFEAVPIEMFPILLRAYEWHTEARDISREMRNRSGASWFVAVTTHRDRLEEHVLHSMGLMNKVQRDEKLRRAHVSGDYRGKKPQLRPQAAYDDDDDDDPSPDYDYIRLYMVASMSCTKCVNLRSIDVARTMHAGILAEHHHLPFKRVLNSNELDVDLDLIFCKRHHDNFFSGSDSEGSGSDGSGPRGSDSEGGEAKQKMIGYHSEGGEAKQRMIGYY